MKKCWLAVDKDGTEKISNSQLLRREIVLKQIKSALRLYILIGQYSEKERQKWCNGWSANPENPLPFEGTVLPKGTIFLLTGVELTWDDEPLVLS